MRLQKWLADAGVASRRKCETIINEGRVSINGEIAALGCSVEDGDNIELDGKPVKTAEDKVVFAFNKPRGVLCTSDDPQGRRTVQDFFKDQPYRLYNVGRLDYESEGLLLMTNDGDLAYRLTHPKYEIEKTYHVVCDALLTNAQMQMLEKGIELDDGMTAPARLENARRQENGYFSFDLTIHEGKNREVRRMVEKLGRRTVRLQRLRIGCVNIKGLESGEWRSLTKDEVIGLSSLCK